jgi:hypothetical protein
MAAGMRRYRPCMHIADTTGTKKSDIEHVSTF